MIAPYKVANVSSGPNTLNRFSTDGAQFRMSGVLLETSGLVAGNRLGGDLCCEP